MAPLEGWLPRVNRSEITRGGFTRTLTLPDEVEAGQCKAAFKDGILELALPKVVAARRHTVKVE